MREIITEESCQEDDNKWLDWFKNERESRDYN